MNWQLIGYYYQIFAEVNQMAHECPDCYLLCHCNGDIDDLLLNQDEYVTRCNHCWGKDEAEPYDFDEDEPELIGGED